MDSENSYTPTGPTDPDVANQPRLPPPHPNSNGAIAHPYTHRVPGGWWWKSVNEMSAMKPQKRGRWSHIGLIMETTLGQQLIGDDRCRRCQQYNYECWRYNPQTSWLVKFSTPSCARCRVMAVAKGCNYSGGSGENESSERERPKDMRRRENRESAVQGSTAS